MIFFDLFKKRKIEEKASRTTILNTRMSPAHWTPDDYEKFIEETYLKNRICFRCMFMIAQAVSIVDWELFRQKSGNVVEKIEKHPILELLRRPNPNESFSYLLFKLIIFLLGNGNGFIERIVINNEKIPRELYILRPDKMSITTNKRTGDIDSYVYEREIIFEVDPITKNADLLQMKLPNPLDDLWGASPIKALMREIDTSNEAIEWQKKILENEGRPGLVFSVDGTLSDKQYDRLEELLQSKHSGAAGAGKNLIVEGGAKVLPYNWTPKELDFIESHRDLARGISSGWGVPPQMLGIIGDSTYCLPGYSKVATTKGLKNIADIKKGDYVYSLVGSKLEEMVVLKQEKTGNKKLFEIITENKNLEPLRPSGNHPVLIRREYGNKYYLTYIPVKKLKVGDIAIAMHTYPFEVVKNNIPGYIIPIEYLNFSEILEINELGSEDVYDIEVEEGHNFIADGILVHNSNYETSRQVFWEDTIMSYLNLIKVELNNWFFGLNEENLFLNYNLEKIPALSLKRDKLWTRAQTSDFLLINEKRRLVGLDDIPGGDVILIPLNYTLLKEENGELVPVLGDDQIEDVGDDGKLNNSVDEGDEE